MNYNPAPDVQTGEGPTKGPRCGIENCRSRLYEEGEDGYLYCGNGHRKGVSWCAVSDSEISGGTNSAFSGLKIRPG
jgi:hypothetical protein